MGGINNIRELAKITQFNAYFVVDGAQGLFKKINVHDLDVDFYFSGHKMGPMGVGVLL